MDIADLPDFFAIETLAKALWKSGETRGAALFVGAGVSRTAELPSPQARIPPLWSNLRKEIAKRIYAGAPTAAIPEDPLRLAEEFRALSGQAALDDFIRDQVPDHMWQPGQIHRRLLELPWADVLTTNWDRLLERTASIIGEISYEVVSSVGDIARAKAPRIVKLHGSIPSGPFVFAEEDYRTYPTRNAPFVNLARQIFLENELCLVGFSGTDPNFLQWSGWVRDHLGASGRRIYLVGVLDLHPAARRLLESRNVAPVDLAPLVRDLDAKEKHSAALQTFISYLERARPSDPHIWRLTPTDLKTQTHDEFERWRRDPAYAASLLDAAAKEWQRERESYPGWLICPSEKRDELRFTYDAAPWPTEANLATLSAQRRARILFELTWRYDIGFWPIPPSIVSLLNNLAEYQPETGLHRDEHFYIATVLLRTAREYGDDLRFEELARIIEKSAKPGSDEAAAAAYEECLRFRDRLDFANLVKNLERVCGNDPVWPLRRAGLHCALGEYEEAEGLISSALNNLRERQQRDRKSIWLLSRRAWAQFFDLMARRGLWRHNTENEDVEEDRRPTEFAKAQADPLEELRAIQATLDKARLDRTDSFGPRPHFDAGTYTEPGTSFAVSAKIPSTYVLDRVANASGAPAALGAVDITSSMSHAAALLEFDRSLIWCLRFLRTVPSASDETIEDYFSRVEVAQLGSEVVQPLVSKIREIISFYRTRVRKASFKGSQTELKRRSVQKLQPAIEVLSRLAIRLAPKDAREIYDLAIELMRDANLKDAQLWKGIDHLFQRCGEAIPPSERGELVPLAVEFPLPSEFGQGVGFGWNWPSPLQHLEGVRLTSPENNAAWSSRVSRLIEAVRTGGVADRGDAALRLCYLFEADLLQEREKRAFGEALWSRTQQGSGFPADVNFSTHVFLFAPSPDPIAARRLFRAAIYGTESTQVLLMPGTLRAIQGGSRLPGNQAVQPSREDANRIFDLALAWWPPDPKTFDPGLQQARHVARALGPVLASAVMPTLTAADLTDERLEKLFAAIDEERIPSAIACLPWVAFHREDQLAKVVKTIRRALAGRSLDGLAGGVQAIAVWIRGEKEREDFVPLAAGVVDQAVRGATSQSRSNSASLMSSARRLLAEKKLTTEHCVSIIEGLESLLFETQYDRAGPRQRQLLGLSYLRAECVRMAEALSREGNKDPAISSWLENAKNDPLPEVRWALAEEPRD